MKGTLTGVTKGGQMKGSKAQSSFVNTPALILGKGKGLKSGKKY